VIYRLAITMLLLFFVVIPVIIQNAIKAGNVHVSPLYSFHVMYV
jgi:hypothetical protein